jgi:hypothetical protein
MHVVRRVRNAYLRPAGKTSLKLMSPPNYVPWALHDAPGGVELMGGPGVTLSFLLLWIAPLIIVGFGLLGPSCCRN